MLKSLANMVLGAFIFAGISAAIAAVGQVPLAGGGPALIDQSWVLGLANGQNYSYQYGITAAGTTQATATQLPAGVYLLEVDTAAASTGVALPPCIPGTQVVIYNNGAQTMSIYPAVANNPLTSAQDTINNATSITLASHTQTAGACIKAGVWSSS